MREKAGKDAKEVADDWFFENTIRLHRAEKEHRTPGMKPAGLSEGPVVPRAEKAIETGDPKESIGFILKTVEDDLTHRFHHVMEKKKYDVNDVAAGREFIEAFIGWVVYSHHLYMSVTSADRPWRAARGKSRMRTPLIGVFKDPKFFDYREKLLYPAIYRDRLLSNRYLLS